ncbi:ATP-binding cassette domain-containing protein [Streptomyces sp. NPDC094468]|uniref:ATP-binding cassette domain-containing protein n=1 Tax=Streptomyces sp. NPDC094468 TaxID=3366066 RepID=UPI00381280E7
MTEQANDLVVDAREPRPRYAVVTTVDGIGLGVRHGGAFGLLGPDGAGRRTTVEVLPGSRNGGGGEVSVLGTDPATGTRAWRSRIGIVRQDESTPAGLTARRFTHRRPRPCGGRTAGVRGRRPPHSAGLSPASTPAPPRSRSRRSTSARRTPCP